MTDGLTDGQRQTDEWTGQRYVKRNGQREMDEEKDGQRDGRTERDEQKYERTVQTITIMVNCSSEDKRLLTPSLDFDYY